MKRIFVVLFWILLGVIFLFGAWYVLHQDIQFTSDVARDFFLLDEIHTKGIVLIGPSSSTKLYHGILWMYLNYPAYIIGNGNPVVVGWFWILLSIGSVISGFYVAKKLFGTASAYVYTALISLFLAFHVRYFYNPDGAMLIMPLVFFFFVRFLQTKKIRFLLLHTLLIGAVIQFQMAIGIPFAVLSFAYMIFQSFRWKKYIHLFYYLLIPLSLSNFIIFDLRHQFLQTHLVLNFLTSAGRDHVNIFSLIWDRLVYLFTTIEFLRVDIFHANFLLTILLFLYAFIHSRSGKLAGIYRIFLYFYIGFFVISLGNAGGLLYFYVYPLFPLAFLIFSSIVTSKFRMLFIALFLVLLGLNLHTAYSEGRYESENLAGKSAESWAFYHNVSEKVFSGQEKTFGYFVFDPDIVAYQPKYALLYQENISTKSAYYLQKKEITYLVIARNQYNQDMWWKKELLHISSEPKEVIRFDSGYRIEKYILSGEDLSTPIEANIDPGLMFR